MNNISSTAEFGGMMLTQCLLPDNLISAVVNNQLNDGKIWIIAEMIANISIKSCIAYLEGNLKLLDPNPGDAGCQMRAIVLYNLYQEIEVQEETAALVETARKILQLVSRLKTEKKANLSKLKEELDSLLFENKVGSVACSKEMEFILLTGLLQTLRMPYKIKDNGIVMTKTDASQLCIFSKNINKGFSKKINKGIDYPRCIVERAQVNLTFLSMEFIRKVSAQLYSIQDREKEILVRMLSVENTKLSEPEKPYSPKALGCQFYEGKTMIYNLRENKALVALKSIVPKGLPLSMLFFQPRENGTEFEILSIDSVRKFDLKTPMVVIEGVFGISVEDLAERVNQCGLTYLVLTDFSQQAPFGPDAGSKVEDITDYEGREEIMRYKENVEAVFGSKDKPILKVDHIFANTLGEELLQLDSKGEGK